MAAALLLTLCDALVLSPTAAPLRSAAQQPVSRAGPTMILGGGGRFGGALRFTPKMPKLPKLVCPNNTLTTLHFENFYMACVFLHVT